MVRQLVAYRLSVPMVWLIGPVFIQVVLRLLIVAVVLKKHTSLSVVLSRYWPVEPAKVHIC